LSLFDITQGLGHINVFNIIIVPFKAFVPLLNEIVHVAVKSGVVPDSQWCTSCWISTCFKGPNNWMSWEQGVDSREDAPTPPIVFW